MNQSSARRPSRPLPPARPARRALAAALAAALVAAYAPGAALAQLPTTPTVAHGSAGIVTSGGQMTVTNSPNAVINWQSFSIGPENGVRFEQADASSKVLNRVLGNDPSNILGGLSSNGQVWLVNPNGVLFGANARIDVGALVASTLGISDADFLAGRHAFGSDGVPGGQVLNQADFETSFGGRVWLVGGSVHNEGTVRAPGGQIVLAAGQSVDLVDSGLPNVTVRVSASDNDVVNLGSLLAPAGGSIDLHGAIVNQHGIVRADSLDAAAGGRVVIRAQGDVLLGDDSTTSADADAEGYATGGSVTVESVAGTTTVQGGVSAAGGYGVGGQVRLLGRRVEVNSGRGIDASGVAGGGQVLIGTAQAAGPSAGDAGSVLVDYGTPVTANATESGDGGSIIIRSTGATEVYGYLQVLGSGYLNKGGTVETSGAFVDARPTAIDLGGAEGGNWLLRADNVNIVTGTCPLCGDDARAPVQESIVSNGLVRDVLAQGGKVRLEAASAGAAPLTGNLKVTGDIDATEYAPVGAALTLAAQNDLTTVDGGVRIGNDANPMPVTLIADLDRNGAGALRLGRGTVISTAGADLVLGGGATGNNAAQLVSLNLSTLDAGGGTLLVLADKVDIRDDSSVSGDAILLAGGSLAIQDSTLNARAGTGFISLNAGTVDIARSRASANRYLEVLAAQRLTLADTTLSAGGAGDDLKLRTASLAATGSTLATPNGRWLAYLDSAEAFSPALFGTLGYTFVQTGASDTDTPAVSGPGRNGVIVRAPLDVRLQVNAGRVYDGTTQAAFSSVLSSDLAPAFVLQTREGTVQGRFADKNAGTGKTIAVDGASPYTIATADGKPVYGARQVFLADVAPKSVDAVLTAANKVYDGTRAATVSGTLSGAVAGDDVRLQGAGLFDTKDAGIGKAVTLSGSALGGADAGNYRVGSVTPARADITPRTIAATGLVVQDKVYDGTRAATLSGSLSGVLAGDTVSLSGATGLFDDKNVGTGKTVSVSGATLAGADAGNYALAAGTATLRAAITPRAITLADLKAQDKVYDGSRNAVLTASLAGAVAGDAVTLDAVGQFDTKDVGAGKAVAITGTLGGADAANYRVSMPASTRASITPRPLEIVLAGDVRKEYDATTQASLAAAGFRLDGLVAGETLSLRADAQASYASPNAGSNLPVSASGTFEIGGAGAANYRIGATALTGAPNLVQATVTGNVGTITPATLVYEALPAAAVGATGTGALGGTVTGFKGGDTLASATSGTLQWQSAATPGAAPGNYAIVGGGLAAANYQFVQAPGNATALTVKAGLPAGSPEQVAVDGSAQAIATAVQAAAPVAVAAASVQAPSGGVFDRTAAAPAPAYASTSASSAASSAASASASASTSTAASGSASARTFEAVRIGSMNYDELGRMLAYRKDFKRKLFADAIYKLSIDPSLADLRPCPTAADAASGTCRITPEQVATLQAARAQAASGANAAHGARARVANLPQIERKIAVLIGVNDYADKNIPQLFNAIPDADAVSRVFADKLGYEVRVVRNPGKADIVRALNDVAAEAGAADSVVIYYAGHGISLEKNGAGYWLAADASVTDPKGWISNGDVAHLLAGIRSKQVTLISDSCYSGAFAREGLGAVGRNVKADDVLAKRSVVVLSSGGDEPVADEGKDGHSVFAWNFMQVMGSVKSWTPGSTIFSDVQAAVRKEFPQTPEYGALTAAGHQAGGDYLFESRSN
jgi:filamentous hemagglutinin family protein